MYLQYLKYNQRILHMQRKTVLYQLELFSSVNSILWYGNLCSLALRAHNKVSQYLLT
jgi:hypothetical protein